MRLLTIRRLISSARRDYSDLLMIWTAHPEPVTSSVEPSLQRINFLRVLLYVRPTRAAARSAAAASMNRYSDRFDEQNGWLCLSRDIVGVEGEGPRAISRSHSVLEEACAAKGKTNRFHVTHRCGKPRSIGGVIAEMTVVVGPIRTDEHVLDCHRPVHQRPGDRIGPPVMGLIESTCITGLEVESHIRQWPKVRWGSRA